jgi:thioredoxin 1
MAQYKKYSELEEKKVETNNFENVMMIQSLTHKKQLINTNRILIVDISADWCGPCKVIAPRYAEMAQMYNRPGVCMLVKEDVDMKFSPTVRGVPLFQFYFNGVLHSSITGADIDGVEAKLNELIQELGH